MTYNIIATGSKGNAVLINDEILIDCGVSWKKLEPYAKKLKLVLLTHRHSDHFKSSTIARLHKERPTLRFGCCDWMVEPLLSAGVEKRVIDVYYPKEELPDFFATYDYDYFAHISVSSLVHDVPNCCYHITDWFTSETVFYATDTGTLDGIEAKNYDLYMIESNHTKSDIEARAEEKIERGEFAYELRAAQNHLSYEQAMDFLAENMGPNSRYVLLHQHQDRGGEK